MVSDAQKAAIKSSWTGMDLKALGVAFYKQLKANAPEAYAVFKLGDDAGKISAQGLKVTTFIDGAVKGIDDMAAVSGQLDVLAKRHTNYGAKKAHFGPAGPCLLAALGEVAGAKFTPEAKEAWTAFYAIISEKLTAYIS